MARFDRTLIVAAAALALPAAAACRAVIGLDELQRTDCPGAICPDDGGGTDGATDAVVDVTIDVRPDAPKGAAPVSWARWKMPNYPNDAGAPNVPTYTLVGTDEVKDEITGLVWKAAPLAQQTTQADAAQACLGLPGGGWRVPKRIELVSIIDYSRINFLVDPAFSGVKNMVIWSSSEVRPFTGAPNQAYWAVNFQTGAVLPQAGELFAFVLCVKGSGS